MRLVFLILTGILLSSMGCTQLPNQIENSPSPLGMEKSLLSIELKIYNGVNEQNYKLDLEKGKTVLDALEMTQNVSKRIYPFGSYVTGIGGLDENKDRNGLYWQYYVNSQIPMIAADKYALYSDAKIEFRYERQNPKIS